MSDDFIRFECPNCRHRLKAPPKYAGKQTQCGRCLTKVRVPGSAAPASGSTPRPKQSAPATDAPQGWWEIKAVVSRLKLGTSEQRRDAAAALGKSSDPAAVKPLLAALADKDLTVRRAICDALTRLGWNKSPYHRVLLGVVAQQVERVQPVSNELVEPLLEAVEFRYAETRRKAIDRLGDDIPSGSAEGVLEALADRAVTSTALEALASVPDAAVTPRLIGALRDHDARVRRLAASSLGQRKDVRAVLPLIAMLKDPDSSARAAAAIALGDIGQQESAEALRGLLDQPHARLAAAQSLARLGAGGAPFVSFQRAQGEVIRHIHDLMNQISSLEHAHIAVPALHEILKTAGDLLSADQLLALAELPDARGKVPVRTPGDSGKQRFEPGLIRTRELNQAARDELMSRGVDPVDSGAEELHHGHADYCAGRYDDAAKGFSIAIRKNSTLATAYGNRACCHLALDRYTLALDDLNRALALDPTAATMYQNRAVLHARQGDFERAIDDFTQAIENGGGADVFVGRGDAFLELCKYPEAANDYSSALQLDDDSDVHTERGIANFSLGRYEAAIADFTAQVERSPSEEAHSNRAYARCFAHDFAGALEDFKEILRRNPNADVHNECGNCCLGLGDAERAIEEYEQALKSEVNSTTLYNLGCAYVSAAAQADRNPAKGLHRAGPGTTGVLHRALECFSRAIEHNSAHAYAYNNRGVTNHLLGNREQALADISKAIEIEPDCPSFFVNRAVLHRELGGLKQSIGDSTRALRLDASGSAAHFHRAISYLAAGQIEEARSDFLRAFELDPTLSAGASIRP